MLEPNHVYCATAAADSYECCWQVRFPELPAWTRATTALLTLRALLANAGLDGAKHGSPDWNPFASLIPSGATVLIKPNWVHHENFSGRGIDCLVTHVTVIEAILHYVAKAKAKRIIVGDAPLQGCDFAALMATCGVPDTIGRFRADNVDVEITDFRRTIRQHGEFGGRARQNARPLDQFILYDIGPDSALEAITTPRTQFRVTMYDPDVLKRTHAPGKHQYLVARDVIEADVVINAPKLKTHKKSCITGALKNVVGINGHKEFLPHHRKGGSADGGDCYTGRSPLKTLTEDLLDAMNRSQGMVARRMLANATRMAMGIAKVVGTQENYEGSWYGNDTVWRMSLDLQRLLHYGRTDGTLADSMQRTVLTITDAIIAGEGDGPLAPTPIDLGLMTLGTSTAAIEWIHALLMGLDPQRIPLTHQAFGLQRFPLTRFRPQDIVVQVNGRPTPAAEIFSRCGLAFRLPSGWERYREVHPTQSDSHRVESAR